VGLLGLLELILKEEKMRNKGAEIAVSQKLVANLYDGVKVVPDFISG